MRNNHCVLPLPSAEVWCVPLSCFITLRSGQTRSAAAPGTLSALRRAAFSGRISFQRGFSPSLRCHGTCHSLALAGLGSHTRKLSAGFHSLSSQFVPTLQRLVLTPHNKRAEISNSDSLQNSSSCSVASPILFLLLDPPLSQESAPTRQPSPFPCNVPLQITIWTHLFSFLACFSPTLGSEGIEGRAPHTTDTKGQK